jgi:hypothetical protein
VKKIAHSKRRALMTMPGDETVTVYTFQHHGAWEAATARGYWTGDPAFIGEDDDRDDWIFQYDWMREQMGKRLTDYSGDYPVWAYFKKPNMRQTQFFGEPVVLVEAEVPRSRMLISDFDLWHTPLNNWYCARTEAEADAYDARHAGGTGPTYRNPEIIASWDRIFEIGDRTDPEEIRWHGGQPNLLQACIDRIHPHEIRRVIPVTGRIGCNAKR